ncbi:hypothetical protein HELRODRAFT_192726 [Helobdella robusta]|uniref:Septin-type G domain-containing protein n=1 Tax=Helobdella robusta TaxID=6412 RepID=T1FU84_HELRO|nr:hypothetical protein HELRODRAFT_192726 [Helobdella robusta]ESO00080.1 hypothetical protein HELRODRAFT_192726 [Helobdella robusta]
MSRRARDAFLASPAVGNPSVKPEHAPREREIEKDLTKQPLSTLNNTSQYLSNSHSSNTIKSTTSSGGFSLRDGTGDSGGCHEVGYVRLPNQIYRKSVKRGFDFTLMVVGESGLGKSTLINSLFLTDIYSAENRMPVFKTKKTLQVETTQVSLSEKGVKLKLTIVDTPGFGDFIDNTNCWEPIINYIDSRYEEYLNAESRVNRVQILDSRVHCCLYFISPNGHGLKALDIEFMKRLHDKVNIIPLIAKADSMTKEEVTEFKKIILQEIAENKINIYDFPVNSNINSISSDDDERMLKLYKDRVPFAVVGSNTLIETSQGRKVRGRMYPWGAVEVEKLEHNDFTALKNMLIGMHMQDLKDVTNNVHYENFRFNRLACLDGPSNRNNNNKAVVHSDKYVVVVWSPMLQIEEEKREHVQKMKKMELEMEQVFQMKVKEKVQKLHDSEIDLHRRAEQMKKNLEQQEKELEERIQAFEAERDAWEEQNRSLVILDDSASKKDKKKSLF